MELFEEVREAAKQDAGKIRDVQDLNAMVKSSVEFGEGVAEDFSKVDGLDLKSVAFALEALGSSLGEESATQMKETNDPDDPRMEKLIYANMLSAAMVVAADALFTKTEESNTK